MKYKIKNMIDGEIYEADDFETIKERLIELIEDYPCSQMNYDEDNYEWEIKRWK